MMKLQNLFDALGLRTDNGLFITKENLWKGRTAFPNRVNRLIEKKISPDAFFCFDNKPLILFFLNPPNIQELHKAIWNFNESPIAIIVQDDVIEIFNGFKYLKEKKTLEKLGDRGTLNTFTYFKLVTGRTWEQYIQHLNYKNRVDYHLLNNIKSARELLVSEYKLPSRVANALIGKCIFVRYLIDRKVKMKFDGRLRTWTNSEFCDLLLQPSKARHFFEYLNDNEKGFNGDLFPLEEKDYNRLSKDHYQVLRHLLLGEEIDKGQISLFQLYDFSIIPIEFISNVYELFIGENNQKQEGAYYTPLFLVDYILKETVDKKLTQDTSNYECKVLDPACGSGIFLVETLRKIIEKYISSTRIDIKSERFKTALRNLVKENIYGIDKDLSAVQVAIFSIYLTLLDYLEPPGIETFKFPQLLNTNFFESDFFDTAAPFNEQLKDVKFSFITGNPPWKGSSMSETGNDYLRKRKAFEKKEGKKFEIAINNNEIAEGFILRVSDFCEENTQISLIIRSSILYNMGYNDNYSPFRQYWLEEFFIDKVFELAPVRFEVFEKSNQPAVAPAAIIFYRYSKGQVTDYNKLEHITLKQSRFFSLFKVFTINRADYQRVEQKKLKDFDWLWKVLVYGSYLDFNLIKRIRDEFSSIKDFLSGQTEVIEGTGIQYSSNPTYSSKHLAGKPFLDSYGVTSFFIVPEKITEFKKAKVHRLRDERLFKAPMLLVREGIDMNTLTAKCAISTKDFIFKDSITSIKTLQKSNSSLLDNIAAVFSSFLFSYYSINTFSSIGIERERVKNYNKYSLPFLELGVGNSIRNIEQYNKSIYSEKQKAVHDSIKIQSLLNNIEGELRKIENTIYHHLNLDDVERSLIDYALNVNKTLIVGDEKSRKALFSPLKFEDQVLTEYANLFFKRFKPKIDSKEKKFLIEIWHTDQVVGMFFKTVPTADFSKKMIWLDKQNQDNELLLFLSKLGSEKITDNLFVQKDIRGFEKNFFYIVKPNESKLWHKAIGYLDVNEFADAILKAGRAGE